MFVRLERIRNLLQKPYDITHRTLGMLLHYLGKLKIKFSADVEKTQTGCIFSLPVTLLFIHKF